MNILLELFWTFAKIGLFTFGGGYAMISIIENNCVEEKKWISHEDMMNMTVIAESTPGPIAINCATFVGYKKAGIKGAIVATLGMALPSFVIIYLISMFFDQFLQVKLVASAFKGIKIAVGILIVNAAISMIGNTKRAVLSMLTMLTSFAVMMMINIFSWSFSSISLMVIAAVVHLSIYLFCGRTGKKGGVSE